MPQLVYDETSRLTHEFPDDASPDEIQSALNSISPVKSQTSETPSLRASAPDAPGFDIRGSRASQFGISAPMASAPSFPSQVGPNSELSQSRKVILNPEWMQEQTPMQVVGQATKQIGDVGVGVTADVAETLTGNPTTENTRAAVMGRPIPMKEFIEAQPQGITRMAGRASTSLLETAPKLAQTAALTALGVPAALSAGLPFSVNPQGKVDLVSGAVAASVGPAFEAGQMLTASALSRIPITQIVLKKIEENPDIFGFRVIQKLGPNLPTLESEMVRKGLEQTGGTIAANLFLGAAQVPGIMALPPDQRAGATMDALADNFAMSLLGFAPIFSKTSSETMNKLYSSIQRSAKRDLGREVRGSKLADVPGETVPGTVTPPTVKESLPVAPKPEPSNSLVPIGLQQESKATVHSLSKNPDGTYRIKTSRLSNGELVTDVTYQTEDEARQQIDFYQMLGGTIEDLTTPAELTPTKPTVEGIGSVYQSTHNGKPVWLVQEGLKRGFGDSIWQSEQEANDQAKRVAMRESQRAESLKRGEAQKLEEARISKEKADFGGFEEGKTPMQVGRLVSSLSDKQVNWNGIISSRRDAIKRLVESGRTIEVDSKGKRRLIDAEGRFFGEDQVSKLGMDYAGHLIAQRDSKPKGETAAKESVVASGQSDYEKTLRQSLAAVENSNKALLESNPAAFMAEEQTRLIRKKSILEEIDRLPRTLADLKSYTRADVERLRNDGKITDELFYAYAKEWNKTPRFGGEMPDRSVSEPPSSPPAAASSAAIKTDAGVETKAVAAPTELATAKPAVVAPEERYPASPVGSLKTGFKITGGEKFTPEERISHAEKQKQQLVSEAKELRSKAAIAPMTGSQFELRNSRARKANRLAEIKAYISAWDAEIAVARSKQVQPTAPKPESPKGETAAKEPWQQSKAEFVNSKMRPLEDVDALRRDYQAMIGTKAQTDRTPKFVIAERNLKTATESNKHKSEANDKDRGLFERLHQQAVVAAINEGKIESHPDYPKLSKAAPMETGVVDTIAGKMNLTEFEQKGYSPEQVTKQNWIELQRAERRRLGQSETGDNPNAPFGEYENFHEDAVKAALAKGETVDPEVLKDYPNLTKSAVPDVKSGDRVTFTPSGKKGKAVSGIVQEVVNEGRGFNILSPLTDDPNRVVRVWLEDGKIEKVPHDPEQFLTTTAMDVTEARARVKLVDQTQAELRDQAKKISDQMKAMEKTLLPQRGSSYTRSRIKASAKRSEVEAYRELQKKMRELDDRIHALDEESRADRRLIDSAVDAQIISDKTQPLLRRLDRQVRALGESAPKELVQARDAETERLIKEKYPDATPEEIKQMSPAVHRLSYFGEDLWKSRESPDLQAIRRAELDTAFNAKDVTASEFSDKLKSELDRFRASQRIVGKEYGPVEELSATDVIRLKADIRTETEARLKKQAEDQERYTREKAADEAKQEELLKEAQQIADSAGKPGTAGGRTAKQVRDELVARIKTALDQIIEKNPVKLTKREDGSYVAESEGGIAVLGEIENTGGGKFKATAHPVNDSKAVVSAAFSTLEEAEWMIKAMASSGTGKAVIGVPGDGVFKLAKWGPSLMRVWSDARKIETSSTPGQMYSTSGGAEKPPTSIKTASDWNDAKEYHGLRPTDKISEYSPALAEFAKKVNPENPSDLEAYQVDAWIKAKSEPTKPTERQSKGEAVQNPISDQDATRAVLKTLGVTEVPVNIRFVNNAEAPAGRVLMLQGFRPQIELNLAKIGSAKDLVQILYEELIHPFQLDPAYKHLFDPVRALVTTEDIQRQRDEGYKEQSEEEAVNETTRRLADRNIFQRLIDWIVRKVKELFGIQISPLEAGRAAARTIYREAAKNKVAAQAVGERGSEPPKWGEMKREETLRNSVKDTAVRRVLGPAERDAGFEYAKQQFSDVGLKVNPGIGNFLFIDQNEKSFDNQSALDRLLERVKWTVARSRELPDFGNAFLQSVREMMAGQQAQMKRGDPTMFTNLDTFNQLTQLSRAHFSEPAQRLGMMVRNTDGQDTLEGSVDLDTRINYEIDNGYFGGVAGPIVTSIIDEIKRQVGDDFSNDETVRTSIENILTRANPPDPGSIVYKLAQGRLKPKQKATLIQLLNHAKVQEAVQSIIELAKANGVSEPKPKTVPLTPSQKLMAMVEPKNAVAIDAAVSNAVRQAERNAGRAAFEVESAASPDDMALYDAETIKEGDGQGIGPTPEQVEKGFSTPEFSHWRVIRDNLLGYSPVTDKLIRQVIQSEIKGTDFADPTKPNKLDAREIDLSELARQPDSEVNRVFQAYLDKVGAGMDMHNASPTTKQRILALINSEIVKQLELKRSKIRDPFFAPKREPYAKPTQDQAIRDALNAGLFADDRINLAEMVTRVASRSAVKRLLPNIPDLIKTILATPVKNQRELGQAFADELSRKIGVPDEQAEAAAKVFSEAYRAKFDTARESALKSASESLSPEQTTVLFKNGKQLFNKISDFIRAGGMDDNEFFRQYAKDKWGDRRVPTDADINKLRALVEKEDALRQLTPAELAKAGGDPVKLEAARSERLKVTETERHLIQRQIEAMMKEWGSPTARTPREWVMDPVLRRNWNAARNELNSSNVLLGVAKLGRQLLDTATMQMWYIPHRAIANTWQGFRSQLAAGKEPNRIELFKNMGHDIGQVLKVRLDTIRHSILAFQQGIRGRGLPTHIEQLQSGMMMAERLNMRADEMAKRGDPLSAVRSWLMRLWALQTLGHRQFAAMDVLQAKSAIWQEMMSQVISGLREKGLTNAEIKIQTDTIFGNIAADLITARNDAEAMLTTPDNTPTKGEVDLAAWELLQTRLYARIKALGLPADDFENRNKAYAETIAWNRPPSGPGGIYSKSAKNLQKYLERFIPIPPLFGNAVGTSINRALTWFGFGLGSGMFTGKNERGENTTDPWFESDVDKLHRQAEAITGLGITAILGALTMLGVIVVRLAWPKDKKEREEWQAKGISPYTVEFPLGNGQSLKIPLRIGPLAPMAGGLAGFSAMRSLLDSKSKEQAKLNMEAARLGVEPGKATPINAADLLAVAGQSALNMMTGGRTAAGMLGTYSDFGTPNVGRMVSGVVTPMVPLLPAYQELTRLAGVRVDASTGSFWDLLVPSPWSPKRRVNMLGDDVSTPGAVERIFGIVTLGGGVTGGVAKENTAYADLYATGARPSAISATKGYDFNGTLRPMTRDELAEYARLRGSNLKEGLMALGSVDGMSPEDAKTAVQGVIKEANQRALALMGVNVRALASTRTANAPSSAGRGAFGRRTRLIRPSRTRNLASSRIRSFRRPSLLGASPRRRALSTTRTRRSLVA